MANINAGLGKPVDVNANNSQAFALARARMPASVDIDLTQLEKEITPSTIPMPLATTSVAEQSDTVPKGDPTDKTRVKFVFLQAGEKTITPDKQYDVVPQGTVPLAAAAHALAYEVAKGRIAFREVATVMGVHVVGPDGQKLATGTKGDMGAAYCEHRHRFSRSRTDDPNDLSNRVAANAGRIFGFNK